MVKLIASDLDGTILRHGAQKVDKSTIEVIGKLLDAGLLFAPASGRQIVSLKRLFEPVSDRLVYISENGALSEYRGEVIAKTAMERNLAGIDCCHYQCKKIFLYAKKSCASDSRRCV